MKARSLRTELDAFLDYLAKERRYSPATVRAYRTDLTQVVDYLDEANLDLNIAPPEIWIDYFGRLYAANRSARTHARKVSSLKSFIKYLVRAGRLTRSIVPALRSPKLPKTLPRFLTESQAGELVNRPKEGKLGDGRDSAVLNLFYGGGLRLSEVAGLKPIDIEFGKHTVRVLGKGNKTRIVPIGSVATEAVRHYLNWRMAKGPVNKRSPLIRNRKGGAIVDAIGGSRR